MKSRINSLQNHVNFFYLIYTMSLYYLVKLKMLIWELATTELSAKISHLNYGLRFRQTWIAKERVVQITHHWSGLSTTPLTNGCRNDEFDIGLQLGSLRSQSLFQFVLISDAYFEHILSHYSPHSVINWIQIWRILIAI